MRKILVFTALLTLGFVLTTGSGAKAQNLPTDAMTLLQEMYARYHGKWHSNLSFNQTTDQYRNDSLIRSAVWYEHILYPDKLRIDFDSINSGNGFMLNGDSVYRFSHHRITRTVKGDNDGLVFLLGGLYFMPFDQVLTHFTSLGYDLSKFHTDTWKGKAAYVIGAAKGDDKVNQVWIDADKLVPVRFLKYDNNTKEEGTFEDHIPLKGGWSETKCTFYRNDHLLQVEKYRDVVAGGPMDVSIFDPAMFEK
jgi:hypothetical protein